MEKDKTGKTQYPRTKVSELQEARNNLEYFKYQTEAAEYVLKRVTADVSLLRKDLKKWSETVEKLEGRVKA